MTCSRVYSTVLYEIWPFMQEDTRGQQKAHATNLTIHRSGEGVGNIDQKFCQARRMSASYLSAVEARSRDLIPPSSAQSVSTLLGDKQHFRKTLVRHMVSAITEHFPGRPFEELMLLEFGSGAGFFAKSYSEIFGGASLPNLVQTDASPRDVGVAQLDVANITSSSSVLAGRSFDAAFSVDFLSCLPFGAGLDDDEVDVLSRIDAGLAGAVKPGGAYFDFMACMPNSQFVLRFIPHYCHAHPGRFICIHDPGQACSTLSTAAAGDEAEPRQREGKEEEEEEEEEEEQRQQRQHRPQNEDRHRDGHDDDHNNGSDLLFVTFEADLLRPKRAEMEALGSNDHLLRVPGIEASLSHEELCRRLRLKRRRTAKKEMKAEAFRRKVLAHLFRDLDTGGCPDNWELLSYVAVDPAHFSEVFDATDDRLVPTFMDTFHKAVGFLREAFASPRGAAALQANRSYEELPLIEAFKATIKEHLKHHVVEFTEADVVGEPGGAYGRYEQRYHYARVSGRGQPSGDGSCRCLVTKVTAIR